MSLWQFAATNWLDIFRHLQQHIWLVAVSTLIAVLIGVPAGVLVSHRARVRGPVLGIANVLQTIPSLALFGFLVPLPLIGGIGAHIAIAALALYALLPIVRNTVTGILGVDPPVREAAVAMGMTDWQVLRQVELPLASSVILTGIRVALVITIGVAIIAAEVGAGGLGEYIFRGLRQSDNNLLLIGAVPSALMAVVADLALGSLEKRLDARAGRGKIQPVTIWRRLAWLTVAGAIIVGAALLVLDKFEFNFGTGQRPAANSLRVTVGSKDFTESVLLAEILAQMLEERGVVVTRQFELAGNLCHTSLIAGKIDCYPEYTGTSYTAILHHQPISDAAQVYKEVKREYAEKFNVETSAALGFSNNFAILVRGSDARRLHLKKISDVIPYAPKWRAAFGQDFVSRADGYPGLSKAYGLTFAGAPLEMDLSLTYRALAAGQADLIAGNSTDGLIAVLDLTELEDDRHYFPPYEAVTFIRKDTLARTPAAAEVLARLEGAISTDEMRQLNYQVDGKKQNPREVIRQWIASKGL